MQIRFAFLYGVYKSLNEYMELANSTKKNIVEVFSMLLKINANVSLGFVNNEMLCS